MNSKEITIIVVKVGKKWILTTLLPIAIIIGAIIGLFTFFIFPTGTAVGLDFGGKLLAWIIFILLYSLIITAGAGFTVLLYNSLASKLGGIEIKVKEIGD